MLRQQRVKLVAELRHTLAQQRGVERHVDARHQHELGLCREHVRLASESISRQESPEFTALELREALTHLGEITGAVDTEDVLGAIFSSFCLGK